MLLKMDPSDITSFFYNIFPLEVEPSWPPWPSPAPPPAYATSRETLRYEQRRKKDEGMMKSGSPFSSFFSLSSFFLNSSFIFLFFPYCFHTTIVSLDFNTESFFPQKEQLLSVILDVEFLRFLWVLIKEKLKKYKHSGLKLAVLFLN